MSEIPNDEGFEAFGLDARLLASVRDLEFTVPSPVQRKAIPHIIEGRDVIAQAQTGTGKTAAFGLGGLHRLRGNCGVEMLVITPTRELANQVGEAITSFGKHKGIRSVVVSGGQAYGRQMSAIRSGASVVVGTPGRLLDLLEGGRLARELAPHIVVLDEADEMLDMGFIDDIRAILSHLPSDRQTLLFSATIPEAIRKLSRDFLSDPVTVSVVPENAASTNRNIDERYHVIEESERDEATIRVIESERPEKIIIFCRTKSEVDRLATLLISRGYSAKGLHGDMEQRQRERVIADFHAGHIRVLIATDVAARGLDVRGVSHVLNFHIPMEPESYVHRIGRTGRAGARGVAVTFVTPRELRSLQAIRSQLGNTMSHRLVPTLSEIQTVRGNALLSAIRERSEDEVDANVLLETLFSELGAEQTARRLFSLLLARTRASGPERVGLFGRRLDEFLHRLEHPARPRRSGNFSRRNFRGPRRGG